MIIVLDASTLINLANGKVLASILGLPGIEFLVSQVVRSESKSVAAAVDIAIATKKLGLVDDQLISAKAFAEAKAQMNLDSGETECILAAKALGCAIACDDRAARAVISTTLGPGSLTGSIGLLKMAVKGSLLTGEAAFDAYQLMREQGGFLPALSPSDFEA